MPPKPRVGRELIVNGAFELIRRDGEKSFNARSLSKYIGTSTQPILYYFSYMEEVKKKAYEMAVEFHSETPF